MTPRNLVTVRGLCELQGLVLGLSCHTPAAVIFDFLGAPLIRFFFYAKSGSFIRRPLPQIPQFSATARRLIYQPSQ